MNTRRMQFAVGVMALGSALLAGILMTVNSPIPGGLTPWGPGQYQVTIELPEAPGVGPDTPVRKNGLLIGRVDSIEDLDDRVAIRANIDSGRSLTTGHIPHVRTSVLGDSTIDFVLDPRIADRRPLEDEDVPIRGVVDPNPFDAIAELANLQDDIQEAMGALEKAGDEVAKLAARVNTAFGDETEQGRVKTLMDKTETAMEAFAHTMTSINQIIGDEPIGPVQPPEAPRPPGGIQPAAFQQPGVPPQPLPGQPSEGELLRLRLRQGLAELPDAITDFRTVLRSADLPSRWDDEGRRSPRPSCR
jgi:phospholipid/cholesterol/gamma-HCH transport system substrate-binding protein